MKQGRKVEWSGSTLNYTEEQLSRLFSFVSQMDNKVTRVDYCLDIFGQSFEPSGCVRHIKNRDIITHAQSAIINKDWMKGGFTQYVGTKSSETYTRIYDKAAEQKIEGRWSRVETVYQGDRAEASLQAYLQHKSTRPLIRAHVEFPKWKAWKRVMVGDKAKLTVATRRSNTRHWLLEQVAPAIAKELLLDDDQTFLFEMLDRIKGEYRRLSDRNDIYW